jgi:hypothetical protein
MLFPEIPVTLEGDGRDYDVVAAARGVPVVPMEAADAA